MRSHPKAVIAAGIVAAAATVLAACSSSGNGSTNNNSSSPGGGNNSSSSSPGTSSGGYNAAVNGIVRPSTKQGGTLQLLSTGDCDSWDPQRTYYGWCWNMQRLFTRSLMGYS